MLSRIKNKLASLIRPSTSGVPSRPSRIIIETTNRCNLNCPFCLVGMQNDLMDKHGSVSHDLMSREMGTMTEETFERLRSQIKEFGITAAYLHFQGEPMLNKMTPEFARRLKQDGLYVGIFTNGQAFTEKNITALAEAEIDLIRFSVDGASEDTYQVNRVGGKFANVYENMKKVVQAHQGKATRIEWQFLPLNNNEHEVEEARKLAKEVGAFFFTKGFRETDSTLAPSNPNYRSSFLKKNCTDIYKQLGAFWNGDIVPCCYDVEGKQIMGNIHDSSLEEIWTNDKYTAFRSAVDNAVSTPEADPDICKTCLRWR